MYNDFIISAIALVYAINIVWLYFDTIHLKHEVNRLNIEIDGLKKKGTK